MKRLALVGSLVLGGCWATQIARESPSVTEPPTAAPAPAAADPGAPPPATDDDLPADAPGPMTLNDPEFEPEAAIVLGMPGGLTGVARHVDQPPRDLALIRLTLPAGARDGKPGLALLTAEVIADLAAESQGRPALRREIAALGGDLEVRVAATATTFAIAVSHRRWQEAVGALARAVRRAPASRDSIARIHARIARDYRERLRTVSVDALIERVLNGEAGEAQALLQKFEDHHAEDVQLFHRLHYEPRGAVIALWVPGAAPDSVLANARSQLEPWTGAADVAPTVRQPPQTLPEGIVWAIAAGPSLATLLVPIPVGTDERAVSGLLLLETLTAAGIDGRLGAELGQRSMPVSLQTRVVGDGSRRYLALSTTIDADGVLPLWDAGLRSRRSLYNTPPRPEQLQEAVRHIRLRLLADDAEPQRWLDLAVETILNGGGAVDVGATLRQLQKVAEVGVSEAARELLTQRSTMIVLGGEPAETARSTVALLDEPFLAEATAAVPLDEDVRRERAKPYVELALRAVGGQQRLQSVRGYAGRYQRQAALGPIVEDTVWFDGARFRRLQQVLATRIETAVGADAGVERAGKQSIDLSATERDSLLEGAARHPLLLLAAAARGESAFALISTRNVDDRELAVLERIDPARERLRVHIDAESGLLRVIETDEWRPEVGRVHLREEYSDYRTVEGIRVPFFCGVVVGDAQLPLECQWQEFTMRTPDADELKLGGPTELRK